MGIKKKVPVLGGLSKVIQVGGTTTPPGTTISGFGGQTLSVAQLRTLLGLGVPPSPSVGGSGGAGAGVLVLGPGFSGGGPLVGTVPLYLTAPIPAFVFEDGGGGGDGDPGPPGLPGASVTGQQGPVGPAVFFLPDDPEAALDAVPGSVGPTGSTGAAGPMGPAVFMMADDGADGERGPPGPAGASGTGTAANITPDTHPASATVWDDEFEVGSTLDTTGSRFSGANAWTVINQPAGSTFALANGSLVMTWLEVSGAVSSTLIGQPVPVSGAWEFTAKLSSYLSSSTITPSTASGGGIMVYNSGNGKFIDLTSRWNGSTFGNTRTVLYDQFNSFTSWNANFVLSDVTASGVKQYQQPTGGYLKVAYDGSTNLTLSWSLSGVNGTFVTVSALTFSVASFLGAMTHVGLVIANTQPTANTDTFQATFDWFRRTA